MISGGILKMGKIRIKTLFCMMAGLGILLLCVSSALPGQLIIDSDEQFDFAKSYMELLKMRFEDAPPKRIRGTRVLNA